MVELKEFSEQQLRDHAQEKAKRFKAGWMEMGQVLFSIWKEKIYKFWGYVTFDAYTFKELGIKKTTATKLLRSYSFLEKKEPYYLSEEYQESAEAAQVPTYESVNRLRLAGKNKSLTKKDYETVKKDVFERGKDEREVARELTALIKTRQEVDPAVTKEKNRVIVLKRFVSNLKSAEKEMETLHLVPKKVIKEAKDLIEKIESYI